ncbi:GOLPH3/VPS74 family protein [Propionibacteriaceae bacterium Y1700]|uniref:GOLPH3/VPS74 family protein n=1 Tax=Microlunatus sp. Y1700 TaxID=3418487 RepID=UPI003DA757AA
MTLLIAEELALITLKPKGGCHLMRADLEDVLGGALLAELVAEGQLQRDRDGDSGPRVLQPLLGEPPADPVLAQVWQAVDGARAGKAQRTAAKLAAATVLPRLAERELVSRERRSVLSDRWAPLDQGLVDDLRQRLQRVLVDGTEADARDRTMIMLLHGAYGLGKSIGYGSGHRAAVRENRKRLGKPEWPERTTIKTIQGRRAAASG